jgi:peptidoglycan-N-acetylglucosamine deacetylase
MNAGSAPAAAGPSTESVGIRWARLPGLQLVPAVGAAALTFDDGPDPDGTPAVLDALDAAAARATFFVLGEQLVRHHELAREAVARGHELALHGFEHVDHDLLRPQEARDEIARGLWAFETILGRQPRWFRPPFGRSSKAAHAACREAGLGIVYWSASGDDWEPIAADQIAERAAGGLAAGAILLLHDSARFAERAGVEPTAAAIGILARRARERGLELCPLGELVPPA